MLMPEKYKDAILKDSLKRIIHFVEKGEYMADLSPEYDSFVLSIVKLENPEKEIMDCIRYVRFDEYEEDMLNTYVFDTPGSYRIIFDDEKFEVTMI